MRVEHYTDLINEIRDSKINRIFAQSQSITIPLSGATNSRKGFPGPIVTAF